MQWYIIGMLLIILLGMIYLVTNRIRKSSLFGRHLFSYVTKVMLLISHIQSYNCTPMQNSRKYKIQENLDLGHIRYRLERSQSDFKWK